MEFLIYIAYYIGMGIVWCLWLEYYSSKYNIGPKWSDRERFNQITRWPIFFTAFVYNLYKQL